MMLIMFVSASVCSNAQSNWYELNNGDGAPYVEASYSYSQNLSHGDYNTCAMNVAVGLPIADYQYIEAIDFTKTVKDEQGWAEGFRVGTNYVYKPNMLFFKAGLGWKHYSQIDENAMDFKIGAGIDFRMSDNFSIVGGADLTNSIFFGGSRPTNGWDNTMIEPYVGIKLIL